jgi:hypothetical protein
MAHPHLQDARDGHTAKLKKMTEEYGSASGPANNITAPTNRDHEEGPQRHIGFGEGPKPKSRADRGSRGTVAVNPIATYAKGGAVPARARGGRTKKHGSTHVNVIVAPQGGGAGPAGIAPGLARPPVVPVAPGLPPAAGMGAPAMPPRPPMAMPPGGMPPMGGPPGAVPPGIVPPRKRGGRVHREDGGPTGSVGDAKEQAAEENLINSQAAATANAASKKRGGRVHEDEAQDRALIQKTLKDEGLIRSDKAEKTSVRARGGRLPNQVHHMTAGSVTGIARLEKIGEKPKKPAPPQVV